MCWYTAVTNIIYFYLCLHLCLQLTVVIVYWLSAIILQVCTLRTFVLYFWCLTCWYNFIEPFSTCSKQRYDTRLCKRNSLREIKRYLENIRRVETFHQNRCAMYHIIYGICPTMATYVISSPILTSLSLHVGSTLCDVLLVSVILWMWHFKGAMSH